MFAITRTARIAAKSIERARHDAIRFADITGTSAVVGEFARTYSTTAQAERAKYAARRAEVRAARTVARAIKRFDPAEAEPVAEPAEKVDAEPVANTGGVFARFRKAAPVAA